MSGHVDSLQEKMVAAFAWLSVVVKSGGKERRYHSSSKEGRVGK